MITSPEYPFNPVVDFEGAVYAYTLGVGRQLTHRISAAALVIYEAQTASNFDPAAEDSGASNLSPNDGQLGLELAGTYLVGHSVELSGGVRYTRLADATTRTLGAAFEGNNAVSVGLRVGYRL